MKLQDAVSRLSLNDRPVTQDRIFYAIYGLALTLSISIWFIAVRAPLWLDETGSYWQIYKGFSEILPRMTICTPAYSYILWFSTKIMGTSEIALRVPSILAMLGAVYLLYLAAREIFDREIALIAAIVFCLHPIVVFAAIDVRPYAFAVLAANASILILLRLRRSESNWLAALFGLSAACNIWFHYLFATILPALVVGFFVVKMGNRKAMWRQFWIAIAAFTVAFLPVTPSLLYMFHTAGAYVYEVAPNLLDLATTFSPGAAGILFGIPALVAVVALRSEGKRDFRGWQILLCAALALIPVLILFGVSAGTSIHCFAPRHRLDAVPGIALCWALLLGSIRSRPVRLAICMAFVGISAYLAYGDPLSRRHESTWKYALDAAERSASADNAPVVICSPFVETNVESNYASVSPGSAKDSNYFTPLSYYRLSVPVVPLPFALNGEAMRAGSHFLQEAGKRHQRFFALAEHRSFGTLDWLTQSAAGTHTVRKLGVFDGVEVLEFVPRSAPAEAPFLPKPGEPGRMAP
jgi:hypothetical protein